MLPSGTCSLTSLTRLRSWNRGCSSRKPPPRPKARLPLLRSWLPRHRLPVVAPRLPTPGAMGAGLVAMVAGLTIGKKKYADVEAEMQAVRVVAENLRKELTQAVDDDASAFEALMGTFKLPKGTEVEKTAC